MGPVPRKDNLAYHVNHFDQNVESLDDLVTCLQRVLDIVRCGSHPGLPLPNLHQYPIMVSVGFAWRTVGSGQCVHGQHGMLLDQHSSVELIVAPATLCQRNLPVIALARVCHTDP